MLSKYPTIYDVLIIGGGPAGLAAAQCLARGRHTSMIFDSECYRNDGHKHMHMVSTWDHKDPAEYRSAARKELEARYADYVSYATESITAAYEMPDGCFMVANAAGKSWLGNKVILASGVKDILPAIPGYSECWRTGIFHCLYCHGYESGDVESAGILTSEDFNKSMDVLIFAKHARLFTPNVTVYTNGDAALAEEVRSAGFLANATKVSKLCKLPESSHVEILFEDDQRKVEGFLVHRPRTVQRSSLANQLGLELTETGEIKVSLPFNETSLPGVFAAGDCASSVKLVMNAATMGGFAASMAGMQLAGMVPVGQRKAQEDQL